jgi:hypothetical protein
MIVTPGIGGTSDVYRAQVLPLVLDSVHGEFDGRPGDLRNIMRWPRASVSG